MMIPNSIRIGGVDYNIVKTSKAIVNSENHILLGRIVYSAKTIELYDGSIDDQPVCEQSMEITVWHEIIHAITSHMGIKFGDDDENHTDLLAKGIYAVMRDNPFLMPGQNHAQEVNDAATH